MPREFIWEPLGELHLDVVFAFGRKWVDIAPQLGLPEEQRWGPEKFSAKGSERPAR